MDMTLTDARIVTAYETMIQDESQSDTKLREIRETACLVLVERAKEILERRKNEEPKT